MNQQFYLTIPSNTDAANLTGDFKVRLPYTINLPGDWECALVEITYPYSWDNLRPTSEQPGLAQNTIDVNLANGEWVVLTVPPGQYDEPKDIVRGLQEAIDGTGTILTEFKVPHLDPNRKPFQIFGGFGIIATAIVIVHTEYPLLAYLSIGLFLWIVFLVWLLESE